jgi:hypothetical protein
MTSPAQRLRDAAQGMREKAERATGEYLRSPAEQIITVGDSVGAYLDAMGPPVALAVADWLEHEAEACGLNRSPFVEDGHQRAHAVAEAFLGGGDE